MNKDWHDLIQRHMAGFLDDDGAAALQDGLKTKPELRTLYLNYMNLDVALEARASSAETTRSLLLAAPSTAASRVSRRWPGRPLTAAAAGI